jgi:flagellar L-ring protein precursor FlgH
MSRWKVVGASLTALAFGGCGANFAEIGVAPSMSAVGEGLHTAAYTIPGSAPAPMAKSFHSAWNDGTDLFRDPRARRVGDVITVLISMDDKAKLDNKSDRARESKTKFGFDYLLSFPTRSTDGKFDSNVGSTSSSKGEGKIDRTEEVKVSVGAMVTRVLTNGNLLISGSQEVRVNYEMRVLQVAGIVRPRDISRGNTIPYDKISEARISYGGRGRIMEVQQPAWGHQIYDQIVPF